MVANEEYPRMSLDEFLKWDDGTGTRYELVDGVPLAMAPPHGRHSAVAGNVAGALHRRVKPPCRTLVEAGIVLDADSPHYFQADVAIACGELHKKGWYQDPKVIVEILSPSTEAHDIVRKAAAYRDIAPVTDILLVSSTGSDVSHWSRAGEGWLVRDYRATGRVNVAFQSIALDLAEIYAGIED